MGACGLDDLICRDKYNGPLWTQPLAEQRYALGDLNGSLLTTYDSVLGADKPTIQYEPCRRANIPVFVHSATGRSFGGYYYDQATGLYLVRHRVYDPQLGRWLQMDPAGMADSLNGYEYCASDPANSVDPSGEFVVLVALAALGIYAFARGLAENRGSGRVSFQSGALHAKPVLGSRWRIGGRATAIPAPAHCGAFAAAVAKMDLVRSVRDGSGRLPCRRRFCPPASKTIFNRCLTRAD